MRTRLIAAATLLAACGGDDGQTLDAGNADAPEADAAQVDCDGLSPPTGVTFLSHIPASEDFVLDAGGFAVGVSLDSGALIRTPHAVGGPEIIAPNVSTFARGTRQLPGGDYVVADPQSGMVSRFTGAGAVTPLVQINDPNGIAVDLQGFIYVTSGTGTITRVDPDTAATLPIHSAATSFDGITFSPDYATLYFNEEQGAVSAIDIGPNGPTSPARLVTTITPMFLLDGMTADACGNLYIIEMEGIVWRHSTSGDDEMWLDLRPEGDVFVPALNFGSGRGGWDAESLYVMNFMGGVFEADLGVPGRSEPHLR